MIMYNNVSTGRDVVKNIIGTNHLNKYKNIIVLLWYVIIIFKLYYKNNNYKECIVYKYYTYERSMFYLSILYCCI